MAPELGLSSPPSSPAHTKLVRERAQPLPAAGTCGDLWCVAAWQEEKLLGIRPPPATWSIALPPLTWSWLGCIHAVNQTSETSLDKNKNI